jgi:CBS domain-containing protein
MALDTSVPVRDLMRTKVFTLRATDPVRRAIELLEENRITGAPVLDRAGKLVGFLSLRDIARSEHIRDERLDTEMREHVFSERLAGMAESEGEDEPFLKEDYSPEILAGDTVSDWMNPEVISVQPKATLREVCKLMAEEEIHRVLVVDKNELAGLVSTSDVVRYVANH